MSSLTPFRITVCGIPELHSHCAVGVSHVLSILDPEWPVPEAFGSFGEHAKLELRFHDIVEEMPGWIAPEPEHVEQVLAFGRDLMREPVADAHLLVHCHAGVSRSTASMILTLAQARPDAPPEEITQAVLRIRPQAWPNLRIIEMGDAQLGRGSAVVAAVHRLYRHQLEGRPELAQEMTRGGRGREVAAGLAAG